MPEHMTPERTYRIGQIVPSSNLTVEQEIPAMLRAREAVLPERFSCHIDALASRATANAGTADILSASFLQPSRFQDADRMSAVPVPLHFL